MAVRVSTEQLREALKATDLDTEEGAAKPLKRLREARRAAAELTTLERDFSKAWTRAIGLLRAVLTTWREAERERDALLARLRKALGPLADQKDFLARYASVQSHDARLVVSRAFEKALDQIDEIFPGYEPTVGEVLFAESEDAKRHAIARVNAENHGHRPPPFVSARVRAARQRAKLQRFETRNGALRTGEDRERAWSKLVRVLQIEAEANDDADGSSLVALEAELEVLREVVPLAEALPRREEGR